MPVTIYEICPLANRFGLGEAQRVTAVWSSWLKDGRGQSPALYWPLHELQSTGRLGMNTMGTLLFAGERFSSKTVKYITQMH